MNQSCFRVASLSGSRNGLWSNSLSVSLYPYSLIWDIIQSFWHYVNILCQFLVFLLIPLQILLHISFPIPLQREGYSFSVKCLQDLDKRLNPFPYVIFVGTKHAGEAFFTVKGRPHELPAVIVQESRSQAYASSCCYIRKSCVMICTIEIIHLSWS